MPFSQKLKKSATIFILVAILAANFSFVKPADALFGIADQSFNFTMGDIPRLLGSIAEKIGKQLLEQMRKQMIRMLTNDIVNWVQNGGKPRFVQNFGAEVKKAGDRAAGQVLQDLFFAKGVNICSPFRASVNVMVQKVIFPEEEEEFGFQCTLGDINKNLGDSLQSFADDFTGKEGGGWETWIQLHETQNTLAGSYLAASKLVVQKVDKETQTAKAEITLGAGFLDQKLCAKATKNKLTFSASAPPLPNMFLSDLVKDYDGPSDKKFVRDNPEVRKLQNFLISVLGESISEDGIFGPQTEAAVKSFQTAVGISATGEVDSATRTAIDQVNATNESSVSGVDISTVNYAKEKGGGIAMDRLPADEKCIETVVATPGRIVGDQISGVLKSTGIDNIIHADELAQILDGVINAAVNRVATKGLSLINSGKGSWSSPARGTYKDRLSQRSTDIPGMEGIKAAELLSQIIEFRTKAQELNDTLNKLTIRSDEASKKKFSDRLDQIFANDGQHYTFNFSVAFGGRYCKGGVNRAIDNCMFAKKAMDDYDLRQEKFTPGPYIANQIFYKKLDEKWSAVQSALATLSPLKDSCTVPDIEFILNPNPDALPFTDGDRKEFKMPKGDTTNYIEELKAANTTDSASWKQEVLPLLESTAFATQAQYQQLADIYTSLIDGLVVKKASAEDAIKYADAHSPDFIFYASLLMDYDRSGRKFKLIAATQTYQAALNTNDEAAIDTAKANLLTVQEQTREDWLRVQVKFNESAIGAEITGDTTIANKTIVTQKMKDDALKKIEVIKKVNRLTEASLNPVPELSSASDAEDRIQAQEHLQAEVNNDPSFLGLNPSQALAQVMDLNIEQLINELDQRAARVSQAQNETSNMLGKFETNQDERFRLGLEGGDSEWEKYFQNRFQYAFVSWIYDYFGRGHFSGGCLTPTAEYSFPGGFSSASIIVKQNAPFIIKNNQPTNKLTLVRQPQEDETLLINANSSKDFTFTLKGIFNFRVKDYNPHVLKITVE